MTNNDYKEGKCPSDYHGRVVSVSGLASMDSRVHEGEKMNRRACARGKDLHFSTFCVAVGYTFGLSPAPSRCVV